VGKGRAVQRVGAGVAGRCRSAFGNAQGESTGLGGSIGSHFDVISTGAPRSEVEKGVVSHATVIVATTHRRPTGISDRIDPWVGHRAAFRGGAAGPYGVFGSSRQGDGVPVAISP